MVAEGERDLERSCPVFVVEVEDLVLDVIEVTFFLVSETEEGTKEQLLLPLDEEDDNPEDLFTSTPEETDSATEVPTAEDPELEKTC